MICPECGDENIQELGNGKLKCLSCGHVFEEGEGEEAEEEQEREERHENREERDETEEWQDNEDEEEDMDEDMGLAGDLF